VQFLIQNGRGGVIPTYQQGDLPPIFRWVGGLFPKPWPHCGWWGVLRHGPRGGRTLKCKK